MSGASIPTLSIAETAALTRRVTMLSVAAAVVLIVLKGGAWLASGSVAVLASLVDSSLDLLASLATFAAVRYAASPPDAGHRYGHGKAEAFASLMQAGLVFASAALIGREAATKMADPPALQAEGWAVAVMAVSIGVTFLLISAQGRVLRRTGSVAVSGDRAHYAADLASNAIALLGIGASAVFDRPWLDAAAGVLVAVWLLWGAIGVFRQSSFQLMDHELPEDARAKIAELATADGRIKGVHQLRTRAAGPMIHIQLHADFDPGVSLVAAHEAMVAAEKRLLEVFPSADILIHPDPRGRAEAHGGPFGEQSSAEELTR